MLIIAISGKAEHGKDASAMFMKQLLNKEGKRVLVTHYGDVLKFICTNYFGWNGEKDEVGRTLLQHVGTDLIRAKDPEFLVDFMTSTLRFFEGLWDYVIIPDIRVPNEISKLMEAGFKVAHVRVYRPGYEVALRVSENLCAKLQGEAEHQTLPREELCAAVYSYIMIKYHMFVLGNLALNSPISRSKYCKELVEVNAASWPGEAVSIGMQIAEKYNTEKRVAS